MWQTIVVILLLILAGVFVLKRFLKSWKMISSGRTGCPGCGTCSTELKVYSQEPADNERGGGKHEM
ncbi:MAG: FeoB-associated Cys-rich membrane protein [Desulfohalobiaceae bacterium]|nr:FeoB-associated Cys-rich membrane protein [Desulfohalobiaceae bacterium]